MSERLGVTITLDRAINYVDAWRRTDLLFSQTCGFPFVHEFRGTLAYVATPHYAAEGCEGPCYCSLIFARETGSIEQFAGARAAVNTADSMSGMLALKLVAAPFAKNRKFFSSAALTGSHVNSLQALQNGEADICAIDAVTVALLRVHRPELLRNLSLLGQSPKVPALPFVTRCGDSPVIQSALREVFADSAISPARTDMLLKDFSVLPISAYESIADYERNMRGPNGIDLFD